MQLTKLSIQKIQDSGEVNGKMPSHRLVASDENYGNKTVIGSLWTKDGQYGKFLSGELQKERTGQDGKVFDGYIILSTKEYKELLSKVVEPRGYDGKIDTGEAKDIDSIPF